MNKQYYYCIMAVIALSFLSCCRLTLSAQTVIHDSNLLQQELKQITELLSKNVRLAQKDYNNYYQPGKYPFGESVNKIQLEAALSLQQELSTTLHTTNVVCAKVQFYMNALMKKLIEANNAACTSAIYNKSSSAIKSMHLTARTIDKVNSLLTKASECYIEETKK